MGSVSLRKVGTSYVTTIPSEIVEELHLKEGQKFEIKKENGQLILIPVTPEYEEAMAAHDHVLEKYRAAFKKLSDA
ncbi:MAG: AbrB/MazE/SpoVT family DNA-binding domain-containing protein [Gammaproteobacteria bacterium]|nr:AbrB/MazE/SpoVT family DNA-binding domain-containing protein [Gammaproteobacteria bacterium]